MYLYDLSNELKLPLVIKSKFAKIMMISEFGFNIAIRVKTVKHYTNFLGFYFLMTIA